MSSPNIRAVEMHHKATWRRTAQVQQKLAL
jgi:hypothetical protein